MKLKQRAGRYFIFGVLNTLIGYGIYEVLALTVFSGERLLPFATLVSGVVSVFTGYFLHSRFTWKERKVGKREAGKFLIWNIVNSLATKPVLTAFFDLKLFDSLYKLAFDICSFLHIPFSYEFVESTGIFVLITAVIMVINYLVYDKFVFGRKGSSSREQEEVKETKEDKQIE